MLRLIYFAFAFVLVGLFSIKQFHQAAPTHYGSVAEKYGFCRMKKCDFKLQKDFSLKKTLKCF